MSKVLKLLQLTLLSIISVTAPAKNNDPYYVKYGASDGLSSNTANVCAQDERGFIYVGTDNGLDRFDGHRFKHTDVGEGAQNAVYSICADPCGTIWLGTGNGIAIFDSSKGEVTRFDRETSWRVGVYSKVGIIETLENGELFFGTEGQGFFLYDKQKDCLRQFTQQSALVCSVASLPNGNLLIGSEEGTLAEYSLSGDLLRTIYSDSGTSEPRWTQVCSIALVDGQVWAGMGHKGFCRFSDGKPEYFKADKKSSDLVVKSILNTPKGLLLGCESGLYYFDPVKERFENVVEEGREPLSVEHVFEDKDGGLWVSLRGEGVMHLPMKDNELERLLEDRNASALCKDEKGDLWIGTRSGILYCADAKGGNTRMVKDDFPDIRCLLVDLPEIWIGTASNGVFVYNTATGRCINHRYDRYDQTSICDNCINALFKDSLGKIYVGTEWGLCYYNKEHRRFRFESRGSNKSSISGFFEDSRHNVWIATSNDGLYREPLQGRGWVQFNSRKNPLLGSNNISALAEDEDGVIWIGSNNGIYSFDYESDHFSHRLANMSGKEITSIAKDENGRLWIAGLSDISCIDPKAEQLLHSFSHSSGFRCREFAKGCCACLSDELLAFGGSKGIELFRPENLLTKADELNNDLRHETILTDVLIGGESLEMSDLLKLKHGLGNIRLLFSCLDFSETESHGYTYRLDEGPWTETGPEIVLSNLPTGSHSLEIKASSPETAQVLEVKLKVRPPLFARWWAIVLYVLLLAIATLGAINWFHKRHDRKTFREKYEFFTNITHEIRTPLTLIKAPLDKIIESGDGTAQTKEYLGMIDKSVKSLLELVNQMLDYRKNEDGHYTISPSPCNIPLIIKDVCYRFKALAESEHKNIELSLPDGSCIYDVDQDALEKILRNLLSNAVKYSENKICVRLRAQDDKFEISVGNDGAKISPSEYENIFKMFYQVKGGKAGTGIGLPLARMLAQRHGGNVSVGTEDGNTVFKVVIPGKLRREETAAEPVKEAPAASEEGEKASILIVDDNEDLRRMIVEMLRPTYEVYQAGNGKEGIDALEAIPIDLILCDVMMPEMDGYQFCEYVKSELRWTNIPFVHITAKTAVEDKIKGIKHGADDYIEKPFSSALLLAKVGNLLENRKKLKEFYHSLPVVHPAKVAKITKGDSEFLIKLQNELERHISQTDYNMTDFAANLYMSQSSFYRKVKSLTGLSPNEYANDYRLRKAAELLSKGEYTVSDTFRKVGFNSISYFSQCFKKKYGVSPANYSAANGKN